MRSREEKEIWDKASLQQVADNLLKSADKEWGGFGNAPKFPQTFSILFY
jgi:uncharacterized protein YyaL (SSP411 family)